MCGMLGTGSCTTFDFEPMKTQFDLHLAPNQSGQLAPDSCAAYSAIGKFRSRLRGLLVYRGQSSHRSSPLPTA